MASTFVNNLRLEEMATGEQSGQWGTKTNTNLELIGEALGFGTEAITTNADTHDTTVADATSDAGRAMFIKYTGTLDSACTITISPNTMKRVHIIENGTSGSQNIIISQSSSGANVTIAPGTTKVVYLDGGGSSAAVVDAFAHLAAVDLTVDDDLTLKSDGAVLGFGADTDTTLTHTDGTGLTLNSTNKLTFGDVATFIHQNTDGSMTISGESNIVLTASDSISTTTSGTSNVKLGANAGNSIASGGNYNVVIGDEAGTAITTGDSNVAVGFEALKTEDEHGQNTAIGYIALKNLNAGANGNNVAVGFSAGGQMTTGVQNTIVGASAGDALTDADFNVAIGMEALSTDTLGSRSTAVGKGTLKNQNFTSATDAYNVAIGYEAGNDITTGTLNTLVGAFSGDAMTTATTNVGVGYLTLSAETTGQRNTAMGYSALANQNNTGDTLAYNTAYGFFAGLNITTGVQNTLIGGLTGDALTVGDNNVAIGYGALSLDTKGERSVALGVNALASQNFTSATESKNTAIGMFCLDSLTTGTNNTAIGYNSGGDMTTGSKNTIVGSYDGNGGGLDIRTSDNFIVLSDGDGNPRQITTNSGTSSWTRDLSDSDRANNSNYHAIHNNLNTHPALVVENSADSTPNGIFIDFSDADPDNTSQWFIKAEGSTGAERFKVTSNGNTLNANDVFGAISDEKLKEQIKDASSQWNDIKALKIRKYKFKTDVAKGDSDEHWRLGVIAQELETSGMNGLVMDIPDMIENEDGKTVESGTTTKSVKTSIIHMKAVKALQEAMARIEALEAKVTALEG